MLETLLHDFLVCLGVLILAVVPARFCHLGVGVLIKVIGGHRRVKLHRAQEQEG